MLQEPLTLPVGTTIQDSEGERYVIEDLLGQGGFSAVYLVRERRSKQNYYALKEIIDPDDQEREQLTFEAGLLRRLAHRSLPNVYQVFEDTELNRIYMLMDYVQGRDLEQLRRDQPEKRFSLALTLTLLTPIVDALTYLHAQKTPIIHRDIKPSNIIVPMGKGEAVLVDFGLAKEYVEDKTTSVFRFGTPGYAAPEQYGQGTNIRTDIYALGATIYTLLTGKVPTDALTRTMGQPKTDPLVPAHQICDAVSGNVSTVIEKAMSLKVEDRFENVEEFWQALSISLVQPETGPISEKPTLKQPVVLSQEDLEVLASSHQPTDSKKNPSQSRPQSSKKIRRAYVYVDHKVRVRQRILFGLLALILVGVGVDILLASTVWRQQTPSPATNTTHPSQGYPGDGHPPDGYPGDGHPPDGPPPDGQPPDGNHNGPCDPEYAAPPGVIKDSVVLVSCYQGTMHHIGLNLGSQNFQFFAVHQSPQGSIYGQFQAAGQSGPFTGTISKAGKLNITVKLTSGEFIDFSGHTGNAGYLAGSEFSVYNATQTVTEDYGDWTASVGTNIKP
ncbi:hypothetical protein KDW_18410 [Dictyobacter vulcani]|uniref:non-specific serine/threonine protein kinase n=1 Tax=Dictyobacter vulcani TaxID=2607529 RepID=A0A5J4KNH3_9CHLR|nr:serine/threonine-protein kinase [Dictyobacter vulcani]GER87679.1 hypothetical protein KDW_18410 [Dictyobacter vulcani]